MFKKVLLLGFIASFFATSTAQAAGCYTASQFEAEQGLRIHSELMVIALTCLKAPQGGAALYDKYQQFTRKHQNLLSQYEADLMRFYKSNEKLHNLRTGLANEISQHAIHMSTASFCQRFGGRIDQALTMDQNKLRRWAQQVWPQSPVTQPVCSK